MKKLFIALFALAPLAAGAQEKVKTGWNFGPLPAIGYNSDLGFQLGALCDIYHYGDGSVFPGYRHKFNIEASYYFKGSGLFHFFYDSKYLIPGKIRLTFAASYLPNPIMSFYGFNGAGSPYHRHLDKRDGVAFYSMKRDATRVLADFSGRIAGPLHWAFGASFWNYKIGDVGLKKYEAHAGNSLYNLYRRYGLINDGEASGGSRVEFKVGLTFDTRDHEAAPSRGVWAEAVVYGSPDMFHRLADYVKVAAHFRHYIPLAGDRLVAAYHLAYQGTVAGDVPFYMQSNITTPYLRQVHNEGLGSINTLRGMLYNRIVGDGIAWGNAELRIRVASFDLIGQQWYVALNPFFDAGAVVQPFRLERMREIWHDRWIPDEDKALIYSGLDEQFHTSAGLGAKLVMNRNFIVSVEWAKPFASQDGSSGLNIGLNYIF
ncbi:MAG: outer membrane protein assembly factor [Alistipes sp.]|jgi:outer membrane protein assembly factor BamA|nr:outer membrane protein assembly factor [Alistipes sp.]